MASGVAVLLAILLIVVPVYSENYVVNWDQGVTYDSWGSDKTINVGDTLEFKYGVTHSVMEVSSDDYSACSTSNTAQIHSDMDTTITLSTPGTHYFICATSGHCANGMKLAVTVSGGSTGSPPSTPSPPAGDGSNSPPVTPSSPNTPSYPSTPSKNGGAMLRVDTTLLKVVVLLVFGGLVVLG
ncbi:hypothetical protein J5N97_029682 [Dioscorea zingiberensis]|uniref:Phytocyanin domain-containing protein n=1 Tax=Dioscorea zingiberensis TaxID=325984 RepID=A0A9D5BW01_9LILI|nr:hypothetical protein J5N97_029682 [Dioscorea zingiberensis]